MVISEDGIFRSSSAPPVEQETGARRRPEPLRTLASYRRAASGGVVFGAKFSVLTPGKLSVGDEVVVQEWGDAELQELPPK